MPKTPYPVSRIEIETFRQRLNLPVIALEIVERVGDRAAVVAMDKRLSLAAKTFEYIFEPVLADSMQGTGPLPPLPDTSQVDVELLSKLRLNDEDFADFRTQLVSAIIRAQSSAGDNPAVFKSLRKEN